MPFSKRIRFLFLRLLSLNIYHIYTQHERDMYMLSWVVDCDFPASFRFLSAAAFSPFPIEITQDILTLTCALFRSTTYFEFMWESSCVYPINSLHYSHPPSPIFSWSLTRSLSRAYSPPLCIYPFHMETTAGIICLRFDFVLSPFFLSYSYHNL